MKDRGLSQARLAEYADTSPSQLSKILKYQVNLSITQLSNIATNLNMSELDIITYPDHYVRIDSPEAEPVEAILSIRLKKDKKNQVLKLVFGENDLEILNK